MKKLSLKEQYPVAETPAVILRHRPGDDGEKARTLGDMYGAFFGGRYCYATDAKDVPATADFVFFDGVKDAETIGALLAGHPTRRIMASTWASVSWPKGCVVIDVKTRAAT